MRIKGSKTLLTSLLLGGLGGTLAFAAAPATPQGTITAKGYLDISGTAVANLTASPKFPDSPDVTFYYPYFEWNADASGDISIPANNGYGENYGAIMQGYFYPPSTGDYIFFLSADDGAQLFLSTNDDPANKKLIAEETGWSNPRNWDSVGGGGTIETKNSSTFAGTQWATKDPSMGGAKITLTQGRAYYIEALFKEGGGGDNLAVAVQDPQFAIDQTLPIPGTYLSPFGASSAARILSQPKNAAVMAGGMATFSVGLDLPPNVTLNSIKWTKNGADIPDSNNTTISIPVTAADNNAKIRAVITTSGGTLTSDEVTLNVAALTPDFTAGIVKAEFFTGIGGTAVDALVNEPKYIDGTPDDIRLLGSLDTPNAYGENYGAKVSGFIVPPKTGQYRFFIRSDDASQFWLSTDDKEANAMMIAEETGCCNAFTEPDAGTTRTSEPVSLTAGRRYAFYALVKEGGGGDYLQVAVREEGDTTAATALQPISGSWLAANARPSLGDPQITQQPTAPTQIEAGKDLTLTVNGTVTPAAYNFPIVVQWQKDGQNIPGALGTSYTINDAKTTDSGTYRAVVSAPSGKSTNSVELPIAVISDNTPPTVVSAEGTPQYDKMILLFSEPLDNASATTLANYSIDGGLTLSSPYLTNGNKVVFTTSRQSKGTNYNLTINNVKDLFGNTIAANTKVVFLPATPATGLVAYWNFDGDLEDSVKDFHGTARGATPIPFVDGKAGLGQAIKLNGADQFVEITGGNENELEFPGGSMSIGGWFKVDAFDTDWQALIAKGEGTNWRIARRGSGNSIAYAGGVGEGADDAPDVNDGQWHHFVAISDATAPADSTGVGTAIYVDGVMYGINPTPPVLASNGQNVMIGENPEARSREWEGELDEIAIWNRVLTQEEVSELYNNGAGKPLSSYLTQKPSGPITASVTRSGANLVIQWSPTGGTLETSPVLGPGANWTAVGTDNPATIPIGTAAGYYRIRR